MKYWLFIDVGISKLEPEAHNWGLVKGPKQTPNKGSTSIQPMDNFCHFQIITQACDTI